MMYVMYVMLRLGPFAVGCSVDWPLMPMVLLQQQQVGFSRWADLPNPTENLRLCALLGAWFVVGMAAGLVSMC